MNTKSSKAMMRTVAAASLLLVTGIASAAVTTVNLTAQRTSTTLPDGAKVRMWGYCNSGDAAATPAVPSTCANPWAPGPTIVVSAGDSLTIRLTNNLPMPTSIVILGQLPGGGLGAPTRMTSPNHAPQSLTTWPGNGDPSAPFTPPAQGDRVKSFAPEVAAGATTDASTDLTWNNLKPGTYLYETGTLPSIQAPMGLYGVLIVTQAPTPGTPGKAYPASVNEVLYDSDTALLFSEIDPVQNAAVDAAAFANADINKRFDDKTCATAPCYPAAVNYTPTYFLINGKAFDKAAPANSAFAIAGTNTARATHSPNGSLLVRLLNAGLRTHIPSIVGLPMSIVAEDGNVAPGNPKVQNEVLLTAGKTHDVLVTPPVNATDSTYAQSIFSLFDRQLSLSTANTSDGGMQGFLQVASAGATTGAGVPPAGVTPTAVADTFNVPVNGSINGNVKLNDIAVASVAVQNLPGNGTFGFGTLSFNADGTFVFTPATGYLSADPSTDTFTYCGNGAASGVLCADVTFNIGAAGLGLAPVASPDLYAASIAKKFVSSRPGVLANDTDPSGYPLTVASSANVDCDSVSVNPDGSFTATKGAGNTCTFTYIAKNSQLTPSSAATVTVNFAPSGKASGLSVSVIDPAVLDSTDPRHSITDYRWIIQEDLSFKVDPTGTPSITTRTLGTSFHRSHMPVVATGCVGPNSCGAGQKIRTDSTTVDPLTGTLGKRDDASSEIEAGPDLALLDPAKHYYISILPGDAGDGGHGMGGAEIKPQAAVGGWAPVTVATNAYDWVPAQISVFIYEDNAPVNGQNDLNENGLGGFNLILMDPVGRSGDVAGQQSYDSYGMPLSNWLLGRPGCPDELNTKTNSSANNNLDPVNGNVVGVVYTCPNDPNEGTLAADPAKYALAGHALIKNVTPARYDVIAHPAAAREGAGEIWWQTETLEGTPAQDAFTGVKEPVYFQEFGPPGFHTTIGFVNKGRVEKLAASNPALRGNKSITGKITNQRMSHPSDVTLYDSGSYDLLGSSTCQVALNSQSGTGPAIAIAECDHDGNYTLSNLPAGDYELAIWDQWLDQIIQAQAVTIPQGAAATTVALGNSPVLGWFTQYDQNIFMDTDKNGIYDTVKEKGISNVTMTTRYRDGGISNQTATDSSGNGLLAELFPLFNWYVTEADTTRFKQTGVNVIVDGGGPADTLLTAPNSEGIGIYSSKYATGESSNRTEVPGAYSYGLQGFISQRTTINWGRTPYVNGENGGIQGLLVYSTTRPFDDQRYNVQTLWEPLVPRATVNLYRRETMADGTVTLTKVDTTQTTSFDDFVNTVKGSNGINYILGQDGVLRNPTTGATAPVGVTAGVQANMQCPGQKTSDPFYTFTLGGTDQKRCYDGWHNWNQAQAAPYDGRYSFPSPAYIAAHPLGSAGQQASGQTLVSLPPGDYVVEAVTPPGFEVVKEEDKNILNGDSFISPVVTQFAGIGDVFILPDQATLNNANPYNLKNADRVANNATSDLGVTSSLFNQPECVGSLHRVPDYLSLFPSGQLVAPFAGMDRPLCDRKLLKLNDQMQATATFFVFTQVPMAANGAGIILDDATSEFNAIAPDFGEKASVPFVPVSVKDFNGREISRLYSDQWGAYNMMTPSSWLVNPPTPSGYGPNMLITCINDPGPIKDPTTGQMVTDPQYNAAYSNFCYTLPFMPGRTTYLDTPVLPVAAFAAGYNPADCAYPDTTPAISRVDGDGFGPYVAAVGSTLTITALGDQIVPNPAYAGPFALTGPSSKRYLTRTYDFGAPGPNNKVTINGTTQTITSWSPSSIVVTVPPGTTTGELVITAANGKSSIDAVTVTVGGPAPTRVQGANGQTIQAAIDAANPGDLILVDAGTYNELVIMWKPVRLQGVGAASVIINAAKYPTSKLEAWRPTINSLFSVDVTTGNQVGVAQVDPLPTQEITGGVVLLEPSVLGSEQGPGITVLAADPSLAGCGSNTVSTYNNHLKHESNFNCVTTVQRARIDGLSVTGGDSGGGIYVNGWAHNLEISNNRVYGNAGALNGGIRIGVPYLEQEALLTNNNGTVQGFGYDNGIKIHHNAVTKNGTVESTAGAGGAGGGVSICSGTDGYSVDHNWICGNFSASDGGGIGHIGFSQGGKIANNQILFNQSFQQTSSTHGGGIMVVGEPPVAGTVSLGTGNVTIDANVIRGNSAEGGHGGGIRLQQVNGADVELNRNQTSRWFKATVTNNVIDNNVAGYSGGGISLADTLVSVLDNNTIVSNDSVGIAGTLLSAAGAPVPGTGTGVVGTGKPSPAGISSESTSAQLKALLPNGNTLSAAQKAISSPDLVNNIVWKNRSFFYKAVAGNSTLCSSNNVNDATAAGPCNQLLPQGTPAGVGTTGLCVNTNAGAPAYWDLGVVGDSSAVPGATAAPSVHVDTATRGPFGGVTLTVNAGHGLVANGPLNSLSGVVISGFTIGTSGTNNFSRYNGTFTVIITSSTTLTYLPTNFGVTATQFNGMGKTTVFVQGPAVASTALNPTFSVLTSTTGYTANNNAANNTNTDPKLVDMYCNGSRVTPEFPSVINPPSPKTLQVAATVDEGNNYVTLRYGPLYQSKPTTADGTAYVSFGDLHLGAASTAKDSGTPVDAVTHDVDGDQRGPGATGPNGQYDRGADEIRYSAPVASLSGNALSFGKQPVDTTSAPLVLTVTNTGDAGLTFNAAYTISGNNFAIVSGAGTTCNVPVNQTVAVGASCTISVTFRPTSQGDKTGTLTLHDNAGTGTQAIALSGTGTQVTATFTTASLGTLSAGGGGGGGPSLDFGNLSGAQSSIVTITVSNGPVSFTAASVTNSNGGSAFSKTGDTCSGHTFQAGTTCTVTLGFTAPSGTTNRSGTLTVTDTAFGSPQTLRLSGQ
jgi:hypothetical protein